MSTLRDFYFVGNIVLVLGTIMIGFLVSNMATGAEVPPIDAVAIEHTETATFALG